MRKKSDKDMLLKIYTQSEDLSKSDLAKIHASKHLQNELLIAKNLNKKIKALPREPFSPPPRLRELVFRKIFQPAYKIWHILLVMFIIILSPVFLAWEVEIFENIIEDNLLVIIFIYYGVLITLLLLPLSFQLMTKHKNRFEGFQHQFDDYLDTSITKAKNILKKPNE